MTESCTNSLVTLAFATFIERLRFTPAEEAQTRARFKGVSTAMNVLDAVVGSRLIGSTTRSTAVTQFSDIDILATLQWSVGGRPRPQFLLDALSEVLINADYGPMQGSTALTLAFRVGPSVDVVPGLIENSAGTGSLLIPADDGTTWTTFDPLAPNEALAQSIALAGPLLTGTIKVVKWWNFTNSMTMPSYDIEVAAIETFDTPIISYPLGVRDLFRVLRTRRSSEPARTSRQDHRTASLEEAVHTAQSAVDEEAGSRSSELRAITRWRTLLGERFPDERP